jgi:conjugal transfer pilus assembly protein TraV
MPQMTHLSDAAGLSALPLERALPKIQRLLLAASLGVAGMLSGCAGLSGLDGSSKFQCAAPAGVPCQSVTGVHANERAGNLPAQRQSQRPEGEANGQAASSQSSQGHQNQQGEFSDSTASSPRKPAARNWQQTRRDDGGQPQPQPQAQSVSSATAPAIQPLGAIRSDPTVIRIWVAPWEDVDGDLNDQTYVYLQIDAGRWLIEHNRERIRREFAPATASPARNVQLQSAPLAVASASTPAAGPVAGPAAKGANAGSAANPDTGARADALAQAISEGRRRAEASAASGASTSAAGANSSGSARATDQGTRP